MDLRLSPVAPAGVTRPQGTTAAASAARSGGGADFGKVFGHALSSVSASQYEADSLQREVMMDNPKVGLEETMIAMQRAQIGFQSALHVRNRMVQAYTDIMNMQV